MGTPVTDITDELYTEFGSIYAVPADDPRLKYLHEWFIKVDGKKGYKNQPNHVRDAKIVQLWNKNYFDFEIAKAVGTRPQMILRARHRLGLEPANHYVYVATKNNEVVTFPNIRQAAVYFGMSQHPGLGWLKKRAEKLGFTFERVKTHERIGTEL